MFRRIFRDLFAVFLVALGVFTSLESHASEPTLFPEDGSLRAGTWWIAGDPEWHLPSIEILQNTLALHGVAVRRAKFPYTYLQDVLFFDETGRALLQVDLSGIRDSSMTNLTRGVYNDDGVLTLFQSSDAAEEGLPHRDLRATLTEGGALISGRFRDGTPYVLTDVGAVDRASAFLRIPREEARSIVARDLGIDEKNLIELSPWGGHLDLSIQAFPGGVLLLHDPSLKDGFLQEALVDAALSDTERAELEKMRGEIATSDDRHLQSLLDENAEHLRMKGFEVIRVAGRFSQRTPKDLYPVERINFLNGTVGRGEAGELFVLTNRSAGVQALQRVWAKKLSAVLPIRSEHIYFLGKYGFGAGLDCVGVLSPAR